MEGKHLKLSKNLLKLNILNIRRKTVFSPSTGAENGFQ